MQTAVSGSSPLDLYSDGVVYQQATPSGAASRGSPAGLFPFHPLHLMTDPTPLSPAAQAVLNAAQEASERSPDDILNEGRQIAVAVLKALADHVTSDEIMDSLSGEDGEGWSRMKEREIIRDELLARAAELEGQP